MVIASPASAGEAISRDHFTCNDRLIMEVGENPSSIFYTNSAGEWYSMMGQFKTRIVITPACRNPDTPACRHDLLTLGLLWISSSMESSIVFPLL
jgi:hypothetical protein